MPGRRPTTLLPRRATGAFVVALLVTAAACSGSEGSDASPSTAADPPVASDPAPTAAAPPTGEAPSLESSACVDPTTPVSADDTTGVDIGMPALRCQTLTVPEDRDRPTGRQVELPVLRVGEPTDDPVIYLHGGPGAGAVQSWASWSALADGLGRELVVYDQRGGGASTPRLSCPERDQAMIDVLSGPVQWLDAHATVSASLDECQQRLRREGTDLDQYDTPTSTRDLEDLRVALGVSTMTLVGVSYGTRLALDYLRTHPEHVSSLVLDSVDAPGTAGPVVERELGGQAVTRLIDACGADLGCTTAHPALAEHVDQAVQRFDDSPHAATLPASQDGTRPARPLLVTGDEIYAGLFTALYDTSVIPLIPLLIDQLAAGETNVIDLIVQRSAAQLFDTATGAATSINCADQSRPDGAAYTADATADPGRSATLVLAGTDSFCDVWPVDPVDRDFVDGAPGDATGRIAAPPTLVVAGELDPITPAQGSQAVADSMDATYLVVPRAGHGPMLTDACARSVLRSFLQDATAPDLACAATAQPLPFA